MSCVAPFKLVVYPLILLISAPALVLGLIPPQISDPESPAAQHRGVSLAHAAQLEVSGSLTRYEPGDAEARSRPGVDAFFKRFSPAWQIMWDERGNRPGLLSGVGIPLLQGRGNSLEGPAPSTAQQVTMLLNELMAANPAFFEVEGSDFVLDAGRSANLGAHRQLWFIELQQVYQGVPVEGAYHFFRINHGNLVQLGSHLVAPVALSTQTRLTPEAALELTLDALGRSPDQITELLDRGSLKIYPVLPAGESAGQAFEGQPGLGYGHLLVRELVLRVEGDNATYRSLVDAHSHEVIDLVDINDYLTVEGGVYLESPLDPEVVMPLLTTITPEGYTALDGIYARINDACGPIWCSDADDGSIDGVINLGTSGGTDCTTPGHGGAGNTHAARTSHYHVSAANRIAATYYPTIPWLSSKLTINTNINGTCNAYWNGSTLNFFRSDGSCKNAGENPEIILHEWAHGLDANTGGGGDYGSGEAAADTLVMLHTRDSCIAEGFYQTGDCYNCQSCSGIRDPADFSFHEGVATIASPATVTSNDGIDCDRWSCPYYGAMGVMGYVGHCESYIASSAIWDLGVELRAAHGHEAGWALLEQIWYDSLIPSKQAYQIVSGGQCNPSAAIDGCAASNYYQVFLVADDDDGNLANGTPNACLIWDALSYHGIACGTRPDCSGGCLPVAVADAGPDQVICAGASTQIGTPALLGHTYSWSPGSYTEAQPTVAPRSTATYTVTATTICGSEKDETTVIVIPIGGGAGLSDDLEGDTSGWTTTGLWHKTDSSSCATPGYSSPTHAFYFGLDSTCDYATYDSSGDLISPVITGIAASSTLTFDYLRHVESYNGTYDVTEVAVEIAGSNSWSTVWSRSSRDPSSTTWTSSDPISLAAYADSNIRIRFRFDSIDGSFNSYTGWFIDDVVVTGESPCP